MHQYHDKGPAEVEDPHEGHQHLGHLNIVGVASAMVLGGPGALFWMVATSVIGLATKLAESTLQSEPQVFDRKEVHPDHQIAAASQKKGQEWGALQEKVRYYRDGNDAMGFQLTYGEARLDVLLTRTIQARVAVSESAPYLCGAAVAPVDFIDIVPPLY